MDPAVVAIIAHNLAPAIAAITVFAMPVAIVWINKYFKLKNRELELEAELHSKEVEMRLKSLEARQAAIESALGVIGGRPPAELEERLSVVEPPSAAGEGAPAADPQRLRSR
jgi:hypothetical protein